MECFTWRRGTGLASQATAPWSHPSVHISTAIVHLVAHEGVYLIQTTGINSVLKIERGGYAANAQAIPVLGQGTIVNLKFICNGNQLSLI